MPTTNEQEAPSPTIIGRPLPPTLQINPIRTASRSVPRRLSLFLSAGIYLTLVGGGMYLVKLSQRENLLALAFPQMTVRVLLQENAPNEAHSGGGREIQTRNELAEPTPSSMTPALNPMALRTEPIPDVPDSLLPPETPKELPKLLAGAQIPTIPGVGAGNGIGNGTGSGAGNGAGAGLGRGRGSTWIHSTSGGEGIRVAENFMNVKDYIPPEYPESARLARISGDVALEVTIDEKGKPVKWSVIEGEPSLVAAALKVFPRWQFMPVVYKGQKVSATFEIRIRFTLV